MLNEASHLGAVAEIEVPKRVHCWVSWDEVHTLVKIWSPISGDQKKENKFNKNRDLLFWRGIPSVSFQKRVLCRYWLLRWSAVYLESSRGRVGQWSQSSGGSMVSLPRECVPIWVPSVVWFGSREYIPLSQLWLLQKREGCPSQEPKLLRHGFSCDLWPRGCVGQFNDLVGRVRTFRSLYQAECGGLSERVCNVVENKVNKSRSLGNKLGIRDSASSFLI